MATLFVAAVLSLTIAGSVALGITAAYASVMALLHAFARNSPQQPPRMVLVASENRAGVD